MLVGPDPFNMKCCVLLQVVHPTVQELTDIAANCFTVSLSWKYLTIFITRKPESAVPI
jgi:hypothetical protein